MCSLEETITNTPRLKVARSTIENIIIRFIIFVIKDDK